MRILKKNKLSKIIDGEFDAVIHLAAKLELDTQLKILLVTKKLMFKAQKHLKLLFKNIEQFIFASSSSIYAMLYSIR